MVSVNDKAVNVDPSTVDFIGLNAEYACFGAYPFALSRRKRNFGVDEFQAVEAIAECAFAALVHPHPEVDVTLIVWMRPASYRRDGDMSVTSVRVSAPPCSAS